MINGILFDLDGTLLEHRTAADTAIGAWVSERAPGNPRLGEAAALWAALEEPHLAAWHAGECSWQEQRRRRLRALCAELAIEPPADLDAAFAEFTGHYRRGWTAFADAAAALAALDGFRIGVLTNGAQEIQEEKVRAIGLEGLAGPVLTGEVLGGSYRNRPQCSGLQAGGEADSPAKAGQESRFAAKANRRSIACGCQVPPGGRERSREARKPVETR